MCYIAERQKKKMNFVHCFAIVFFFFLSANSILASKRFIFRLDDVQDYYNSAEQVYLMNYFMNNNLGVSAGIISDVFDAQDSALYAVLQRCAAMSKDKCALFNHGKDASYIFADAPSVASAKAQIQVCDAKIKQYFNNYQVEMFIPHQNSWGQNLLTALKQLGYLGVSASTDSYSGMDWDLTTDPIQMPQQTQTGDYQDDGSWAAHPINQIVSECQAASSAGQVCVIMLHPEEFANGAFTLTMLGQLVNQLKAVGFTSTNFHTIINEVKGGIPTSAPTTAAPTQSPTKKPTRSPTARPTTRAPSAVPTKSPSQSPTQLPTKSPSQSPTRSPTNAPSAAATTNSPSISPSRAPSTPPTKAPTINPSALPSLVPTSAQTNSPSTLPSQIPSKSPSQLPTTNPTTTKPTTSPSSAPTIAQTTTNPTQNPSTVPTQSPTANLATVSPSAVPATQRPSSSPSQLPTNAQTSTVTSNPTANPSQTNTPTQSPTGVPAAPTAAPSLRQTTQTPSALPTLSPTNSPSSLPTLAPSTASTTKASIQPSQAPSSPKQVYYFHTTYFFRNVASSQFSQNSQNALMQTMNDILGSNQPQSLTITDVHSGSYFRRKLSIALDSVSNRFVVTVEMAYLVDTENQAYQLWLSSSRILVQSIRSGAFLTRFRANAVVYNAVESFNAYISLFIMTSYSDSTAPIRATPNSSSVSSSSLIIILVCGGVATLVIIGLVYRYISRRMKAEELRKSIERHEESLGDSGISQSLSGSEDLFLPKKEHDSIDFMTQTLVARHGSDQI